MTYNWRERHYTAFNAPGEKEKGIVFLYRGWDNYADYHRERYGSTIGEDYLLGPAWAQIGEALLTLLNGELGALDGGAMDQMIRETLERNDCEVE